MRTLPRALLTAAAAAALYATLGACAPGSRMLLEGGMFGNDYTPPAIANTFDDGTFLLTLASIKNGGMGTDFAIELTVRNVGKQEATFDPGEVEIHVPETGLSYFHVTRNSNVISVPPGINVFMKTSLRPGQAMQAMLWYKTPQGKAEAKTLDVIYAGKTLHFPPRVATPRADEPEED